MKLNIQTILNSPATKLGVIAILLIVAVGLEQLLVVLDVKAPYLIVLPIAVICCDLYGFRASAITAVISSAIAFYLFIDPLESFDAPAFGDAVQLLAFLAGTLFVCWVLSIYRSSVQSLEDEVKKLGSATPRSA